MIQRLAKTLLLDNDLGLRQVGVNALFIAVDVNLLFKFDVICHMVHAEHVVQQVDPIRSAVLVLVAPALPSIDKLARRLALFCVCHRGPSPFEIDTCFLFYHIISDAPRQRKRGITCRIKFQEKDAPAHLVVIP